MTQQPKPQGGAFGPSHAEEQRTRRETILNDLKVSRENDAKLRNLFQSLSQFGEGDDNSASTYHSHTHDESGGRFAQINKQNISGSKPTVDALAAPNWAPQAVGVEPFIDGRECGDTFGFALGERHEWGDRDTSVQEPDVGAKEGPTQPPSVVGPSSHIAKRRGFSARHAASIRLQ
jgi:hypothetical protein